MKKNRIILFVFSFAIIISSCTKTAFENNIDLDKNGVLKEVPDNFFKISPIAGVADNNNTQNNSFQNVSNVTGGPDLDNGDVPILLGNQLTNPYTVANMQSAYNTLYGGSQVIVANNLYVKFRPVNTDQLAALEETDVELQDYPMDYEVLQDGDYWQDPALGAEDIPWLYAAVPVGYTPPAGIQYQVISPIFIPENDLVLEGMAESLAAGGTYRVTVQGDTRTITRTDATADPYIISNRIQCLIGYHPEPDNPNVCIPNNCPDQTYWNGTACVYCPPGYYYDPVQQCIPIPTPPLPPGILVEEQRACNTANINVPVRQLRVVCKRWFKIWRGYTDDNGRYNCTKRFKNQVKIIVKTKNDNARVSKVRGIRFWQMLFPCRKRLGVFAGNDVNNIRYVFTKPTDGSASNKDLGYWAAMTTHNSVIEFRDYTSEFGLTQPPTNLKIMVTNWGFMRDAGAAPMWHKCHNNGIPAVFATYFIANQNYVSAGLTVLLNTLKNQMDVIVGYASTDYNCLLTSSSLKSVVYHEMGHTQHYAQVGCNFWEAYRSAIVLELSKLTNDPYGTGNDTRSAPILALGEMWGNHCEKIYANRYFADGGATSANFRSLMQGISYGNFLNTLVTPNVFINANLWALESFNPNLQSDTHRWIPKGLPYDLFDDRNDASTSGSVVDNVSGFTINQSFDALQADVRSIPAFRDRLLLQNNNNQQTDVIILFNRYGY